MNNFNILCILFLIIILILIICSIVIQNIYSNNIIGGGRGPKKSIKRANENKTKLFYKDSDKAEEIYANMIDLNKEDKQAKANEFDSYYEILKEKKHNDASKEANMSSEELKARAIEYHINDNETNAKIEAKIDKEEQIQRVDILLSKIRDDRGDMEYEKHFLEKEKLNNIALSKLNNNVEYIYKKIKDRKYDDDSNIFPQTTTDNLKKLIHEHKNNFDYYKVTSHQFGYAPDDEIDLKTLKMLINQGRVPTGYSVINKKKYFI